MTVETAVMCSARSLAAAVRKLPSTLARVSSSYGVSARFWLRSRLRSSLCASTKSRQRRMDTPVDPHHATPVGDLTASPIERKKRIERIDGWRRVLAWLGLGCIGAAKPGHGAKRCAPGCMRKPIDIRRRTKFTQQCRCAKTPKSAAGALARQPRRALERVEFSVWPPQP
jgi:hypothetical protein